MSELKDEKHIKFAWVLSCDKTFKEACSEANLKLELCGKPATYYVYLLVDPRDCKVFYVGKGKSKRFSAHEDDCRRGAVLNAKKHDVIAEILKFGSKPLAYCLQEGMVELDALMLENAMIEAIGRKRLTNSTRTQTEIQETIKAKALEDLRRLPRLGAWVKSHNPNLQEILMYVRIFRHFYEIATKGQYLTCNVDNRGKKQVVVIS